MSHQPSTNNVDPTTVEIIRNQLHDIAEEMQASVMNSAYSPLWQEAGDLSCGLVNHDVEIIGQSERVIPMHIATMMSSVREAVEGTGGFEALHPEDVLLQNDPYAGNNHLPDFVMAQPVFVDDILLGFSVVRAHWVDIGGSSPTSYSTQTGEIIQEGLRIPPAKLYEAGERNDALREVILANVRDRRERDGDLNAQIAGVKRGHARLTEIAEKYGPETVKSTTKTILSNEEKRVRTEIADLPDGHYEAEDFLDGDGIVDESIRIQAAVEINGDSIEVDFTGTDAQVEGGVNAPIACTRAATYYAVKVTLDPGEPGTSGSYRPTTVKAPKGTVVNPRYPAPVVAGNHETACRIYDAVVQAIGEINPELTFGLGDGSSNVFNYQSLDSGQLNYTCMGGGMGACPSRDGINAIRSGVGNTGVQPVERVEEDYDFITIDEFTIVPDSGGGGRYRGGNTVRRIVAMDDDTQIVMAAERATTRPAGAAGGNPGSSARHVHITPDGEERVLSSKATTEIPAESRVLFQPAGGGGYGDPEDRPPEKVLGDVRDGYITVKEAAEVYDVIIDDETMTINRMA